MARVVLLGGLGVIAETSEHHRVAFNMAFSELGLPFTWTRLEYQEMIKTSGGLQRVTGYLQEHSPGNIGLAQSILILKNRCFLNLLQSDPPRTRQGFNALLNFCQQTNTPIAIASTTSNSNIRQVLKACSINLSQLSAMCSKENVSAPKPDPAIYHHVCDLLGVDEQNCIAIEDSESGIEAASQAGIQCLAFLGDNTAQHDIRKAMRSIISLESVIEHVMYDSFLPVNGSEMLLQKTQ